MMLMDENECDCAIDDDDMKNNMHELTKDEILEFERNKLEINAQRTRLRERIRQNFENFVVASNIADQ